MRRRGGVRLVDLDPVVADAAAVVKVRVPANSHGAAAVFVMRKGRFGYLPSSQPAYCEPTSAASGRPRSRHRRPARHRVPRDLDPVEEVVGRQEGEVAAGVAVARDQVEGVRRDVLLVAGEDDEPVAAQLPGAREVLEVVVGDEVSSVSAVPVPAQEAEVEARELLRQPRGHGLPAHPGVGERMGQVDDVDRGVQVPAVAVDDVVGVPRVRRLDDEHRRGAEPARPENERRVVGVSSPAQAGDVVAARPSSSRGGRARASAPGPTAAAPAAAPSPACRTWPCPSRRRLRGRAFRRRRPGRSGA